METVKIETTQQVQIDYEVAGVGDRILATLLDFIILAGYIFAVSYLFNSTGLMESNSQAGFIALMLTLMLPYFLYDLLCELLMNGQSIGKKALKIKVTKLDGSQPGLGSYLLRWLLRPIDISMTAGALAIMTILVNGKGQRVGDLAAGTTVVKLKSTVALDDTILTQIEEEYEPVFSQVSLLDDKDIATVKKVLDAKVADTKMSNHILYKAKSAVEKKMGVESDLSAAAFLETVLKDYNAMVLRQDRALE